MTAENIKSVLDSGQCPQCQAMVISDEDMTTYLCEKDREHFELKIKFHGGESMEATLNGNKVDPKDLEELEW